MALNRRSFFSALRAAPALVAVPGIAKPKTVTYQDRGYLCCGICGCSVMAERNADDPCNYGKGAIRCGNPACVNYQSFTTFPSVELEVLPDFKPVSEESKWH